MKLVMRNGLCIGNPDYKIPAEQVLEGVAMLLSCRHPEETGHQFEVHFHDTKAWLEADRITGWDVHPSLKNVALFTPVILEGAAWLGTSTEDLECINWAVWGLEDDNTIRC